MSHADSKHDDKQIQLTMLNLLEDQQMTINRLRESELFNRLIFEKSPIGFIVCRMDGQYIDVNNTFASYLGFSIPEILNFSFFDSTIPKYHTSDLHQIKLLQDSGVFGPYIKEFIHADGHSVIVKISGVLIKRNQEDLIWAAVEDITKQKVDEELLKEREAQFRSLYENSNIGFYRTTRDGRILLANPTLLKMLGFESFEKFAKRNLEKEKNYLPTYRREDFIKEIESKGEIKGWVDVWKKKDGTIIYVRESAKLVKNNLDEILYYEGTIEDITESKKTEQALKDSENIFQSVFATISDAIFITDAKSGEIIECNDKLSGYTKKELLGRSTIELNLWENLQDRQNVIEVIKKEGKVLDFEAKFKRKDGTVFTGSISVTPISIKNDNYLLSVIRDISERNKSSELLRQSEEKFRTAFYTSPDSITITSLTDGKYVSINRGFSRLTGYEDKDVIGKTVIEMNIWADVNDRKKMIEILKKNKIVENFEAKFVGKDGRIIFGIVSGSVLDLNGIEHILLIVHDITERKKEERKLWDLHEELHTTLYSIGEAVISTNKNGIIRQMNRVAEQLTGWTESSAKGVALSKVFKIVSEDGTNKLINPVKKVLAKGSVSDLVIKAVLLSKDGSRIPVASSGSPTKDKEGNITGVVIVFRNQAKELAAQEALKRNEERMRAIVEGTPNLFFYVQDSEANTTYVSPTIKDITGYTPEIWMKRRDWFVTDSEINNSARRITKAHLEGKLIDGPILVEVKHASGQPIMLEVFENPIRREGKVVGLQGVAHDITSRKMHEENLKKLYMATEQSPVSIVITDVKGNIEYVNPKLAEISGYTVEEVIGKNSRIFKSGNKSHEEYAELWSTILNGRQWSGEFCNKRKDGSLFWESASISPIRNDKGNITHFIAVKENISDKKKIMEELIIAKDKAEEANRAKDLFLANMSHELRTPLIGILGYSELLIELLTIDENVEMAKGIKRSGKRLLNTLNMILNFAKIESDKNEIILNRIDIKEELESVFHMFKGAAIEKNIKMSLKILKPDLVINVDPAYLAVILENLVNNAVKFTFEGSIEITAGREKNGWVYIKVKDSGIGIEEKHFADIFQEFKQISEGINREFQGTGLGLSIAKKYTEMMNGKILVKSVYGKGTMFTVSFPPFEAN